MQLHTVPYDWTASNLVLSHCSGKLVWWMGLMLSCNEDSNNKIKLGLVTSTVFCNNKHNITSYMRWQRHCSLFYQHYSSAFGHSCTTHPLHPELMITGQESSTYWSMTIHRVKQSSLLAKSCTLWHRENTGYIPYCRKWYRESCASSAISAEWTTAER